MTQEEKELLLKDLSTRLPYGVKVQVYYEDIAGSGYFDETVWLVDNDEPFHVNDRWIEYVKPYLRPMSSMTVDEYEIYHELIGGMFGTGILINLPTLEDFLNKNMFDYRGLIEKGLALEAPKDMYKI